MSFSCKGFQSRKENYPMEEVTEEQAALLSVPYGEETAPVQTATPTPETQPEVPVKKAKKKVPCKVVKPVLHGEGMNAFVTYQVETKGHTVVRRFSDFLWLNERLNEEFLDVLIPPVPGKVIINRFSAEVVEMRRHLLEKFLRRVMLHPKLKTSQFLTPFLTASEVEMAKHRGTKFVNPKAEEKSIFAAAGSFWGGLTGKIEPAQETDPYFDEQKAYVVGLQSQLSLLQTLTEDRLTNRKEIFQMIDTISLSVGSIGGIEVSHDPVLAGFWKTLARILKAISTIQKEAIKSETEALEHTLRDYVGVAESAQKLLQNRFALLERLHTAKQKKGSNVDELTKDLQETTKNVKEELGNFKERKTREMKDALQGVVNANIEQQQKSVALWKELLSELEDYSD
eukprot:TRINITY_DN10_c0_g1_i1.p1 TRINITY_DN10_c0_g1~~TRINITY_DN10_c0_g1_i1.p1  ORF type:complete len:398 (+),score=118.73 TRINITY_DN10_c0_g1_i1:1601-2794(+)